MNLGYVILYVADVETTINFYQQAFHLKLSFFHDSKEYAELDTGNTKLAFVAEKLAESNGVKFTENNLQKPAAGFEIALVCDDVAQAYEVACQAGALAIVEPRQKPWGKTVAFVRDINGILVELCTPIN